MRRLRHVGNYYFTAKAVLRKELSRLAFSHVVLLHNVTTNISRILKVI